MDGIYLFFLTVQTALSVIKFFFFGVLLNGTTDGEGRYETNVIDGTLEVDDTGDIFYLT